MSQTNHEPTDAPPTDPAATADQPDLDEGVEVDEQTPDGGRVAGPAGTATVAAANPQAAAAPPGRRRRPPPGRPRPPHRPTTMTSRRPNSSGTS